MKRIFLFFLGLLMCSLSFAQQTKRVYAKMVAGNDDKVVGRYLGTHAQNFRVGVNDTTEIEVSKADHKVVTYTAYKGQGFVYGVNKVVAKVHTRDDGNSPVAFQIKVAKGAKAVCYPCAGLDKYGWFKIRVDGKSLYVREEEVEWTPLAF